MAEKYNDQNLIVALISTPTIEEAAKVSKVSPRTLHRRLKVPEFKQALNAAKNQVLISTIEYLKFLSRKAVMKLEELLEAKSERVQLQAANSILKLRSDLVRDVEFELRLQALENEKKRRNFLSEETDG